MEVEGEFIIIIGRRKGEREREREGRKGGERGKGGGGVERKKERGERERKERGRLRKRGECVFFVVERELGPVYGHLLRIF